MGEVTPEPMAPNTSSHTAVKLLFIQFLLCATIALLILAILILSCVPPVSRDALVHHLAIPKLYLEHGGIYEIPLFYAYYPMNLDLLYLIPLYFGNDIVPKLIHFSFALLTAWLIFRYLKKRIDTLHGLFAVILFLSIPVIIKLSITAYVDLGLIFFSFAAILCLFKWREQDFKKRHLLAAGLLCGLAMGTKYNGLIVLFLLTLFLPFFSFSGGGGNLRTAAGFFAKSGPSSLFQAVTHGVLFMAVALAVYSPWMIRNCRWTGNPIYPLYDRFFNAGKHAHPVIGSGALGRSAVRKTVYRETPFEIFMIPVRVFFQGQDDDPKYFDGRLNPYLFFLPLLAFLGFSKNTALIRGEKKFLLAFSMLYLLCVHVSTDLCIRYLAPIIPPLVILSVYGIYELVQRIGGFRSPAWRRIMLGGTLLALAGLVALNARYVVSQFHVVDPFAYMRGEVSRDDYIENRWPEYAAVRFINQNLPQKSRIFGLYVGDRGYYYNRPIVFFPERGKDAAGIEQIMKNLSSDGITHLLVRHFLFNRWLEGLEKVKRERIVRLFREKARLIFQKKGYELYELI